MGLFCDLSAVDKSFPFRISELFWLYVTGMASIGLFFIFQIFACYSCDLYFLMI